MFRVQYTRYRKTLGSVKDVPFLPLTIEQYLALFASAGSPVMPDRCWNPERLLDIQPDGSANFCVDFPDFSIGNVRTSTIRGVWNSPAAIRFRSARKEQPFGVCLRCGAKEMSVFGDPLSGKEPP